MSSAIQDSSFCCCMSVPSMEQISRFSTERPDTLVKLMRDAAEWCDRTGCFGTTGVLNLSLFAKGLDTCADLLSIREIPSTVRDLGGGLRGLYEDSGNRMSHCVKVVEDGCDLISGTCDVVSSSASLGALALSSAAQAAVTKLNCSVTLKSFSIKIFDSLKEIYRSHTVDSSIMTEAEIAAAGREYKKTLCDLVSRVAIFASALFALLPLIVEGFAISSTLLLAISTVGLVTQFVSFMLKNPPAHTVVRGPSAAVTA